MEDELRAAKLELERQRAGFEQQLTLVKEERANAETTFSETQFKYQNGLLQERRNSQRFIEKREAELAERESVVRRQEEGIEELKQQGLQLKKQIDELKEALSAKDEQIRTEERKLGYVKVQHQEVVTANSQLLKAKEGLEEKVGELLSHIELLKSTSNEKRRELATRLKTLKHQHKQEIEAWSVEVESKLIAKVKTIEEDGKAKGIELVSLRAELAGARQEQQKLAEKLRVETKKKKQNAQAANDLRLENERLRNLMRERTDNVTGSGGMASELRRIRELLGLEPSASAEAVVDAISYGLSHRRHR
jgi:chromosome segregation ATPase